MNQNLWAGQANPVALLAPQAVTAATSSASLDTTDYTGTGIIEINSAAGTSDTLTTNGTFAADSGWTKGTGWTIGSGKASCDGTQTTVSDLEQNQTLTAGVLYTISFTISGFSAGTLTPRLGGTSGTARAANGTYTEQILCGAGEDPKLELRADADFVGSVDDVKVDAAILAVKIQESDNDSDWTDVSGAALVAATTATPGLGDKVYGVAGLRRLLVNLDARKRYIKALLTPGGTSASFTVGVSFFGMKATS